MSDDGGIDPYITEYDEPTMELVIETLTGTTFEMTVSPTDTVASIKNKIQRVEGIPVSQQHLLFRMEELTNESRLCDHGITAGSTLRLVLSMRGGPISTRRLASSDHHLAWREIKEYVDTTREDILDKLPPGSKVTVLLFREGEHLNLIRVIENEDGSCYPFSDSWLSLSKSKSKESSQMKLADRQMENNKMMLKVIELRRKMEGLSVQKKNRKPKTDNINISETNTPSTSEIDNLMNEAAACTAVAGTSTTTSQNYDALPRIHGDFAISRRVTEMYTDRLLHIQQQRNKNNIGRSHRPFRVDSSLVSPKSDDPIPLSSRNCSSLQAPSIAILEEEPENSLNKKDADFTPPSPISIPSGDANTIAMSQIPSLPGTSRNLVHLAHMAHLVLDDHTERPKTSPESEQKRDNMCNILLETTDSCHRKINQASRRQNVENFSRNSLPRMQNSSSNSSLSCLETTSTSERERFWTHPSSSSFLTQYGSSSKVDNSLGNRVTELNNLKYTLYGRRARIERLRNNIEGEKYGYNNLGYMANIEKIQNDSVKQSSPIYRRRNMNSLFTLDQYSDTNSQSFQLPKRRCDQPNNPELGEKIPDIHQLPNIIPKKSRTRCALCNKRLNITTIHNCRCGGIFCAQHRYSEVHGCQYDYKTEGRKILEQTNPLVAATKLPKI